MQSIEMEYVKSLIDKIRRLVIVFAILGTSLYGVSLDEIIAKALDDSPSLESITHRISANHSNIEASGQFSNPMLSYSENTLDESQPMSLRTVSLQQKLPYFGKLENQEKIAIAQEEVLTETLEEAKVALVNAIKNKAYTVWELERLYKVICDYEDLTRQKIELFESYTSMSENQHMGIMSAELTLSDLRIQKSALNAKVHMTYAELSYLASFEVKDLTLDLFVSDMPGASGMQEGLTNNHNIALKDKELHKSNVMAETADLNNYPDVNLIGGYSMRKNFDDFWVLGLGVSLPVYGTEDYKEEEARKLALAAQSMKADTIIAVDSQFQMAYLQMKSAYEIYHIVQDQALPQIEHMFELTSSSISTGGDLFKYIDILVQKLKLEQKSIAAIADYNRAEAKISALSGELE